MAHPAEQEGPIARIIERAEAVAGGAISEEERARRISLRTAIRAEHLKHTALIDAAEHSTRIFTHPSRMTFNPTEWHKDVRPPIKGLPDGVEVSYRVAPAAGDGSNIRIRLKAEGNDSADEGELAYAGKLARKVPFAKDDQEISFDTAVMDLSTGQLLDSDSDSFALAEHAVSIVTAGQEALEASRAARYRTGE